jgi:hypothetical protein
MASERRFIDAFGQIIELTAERWLHVLVEHQELQAFEDLIPQTLQGPDEVAKSVHDPNVRLYYKLFPHLWHGKYLVVVVKCDQRHFLLTAYITDKVKGGARLWRNA